MKPDETCDLLCGDWRIQQLRRGHRFSTDDVLTAWIAARARPQALRLLDLGAGIGSVGLMTLWRMAPTATSVFIEAQQISHDLCERTLQINAVTQRVDVRLGDLRDPSMIHPEEAGSFDLVTGSPPYIPLGKGHVSPHPQRAAARMELRGDISSYCEAAARALAPNGAFCFCHSAVDPRPETAVQAAGLTLLARQDVFFRADRAPTIALFQCAWRGTRADPEPIVIRGADGHWTAQYLEIRREQGNAP